MEKPFSPLVRMDLRSATEAMMCGSHVCRDAWTSDVFLYATRDNELHRSDGAPVVLTTTDVVATDWRCVGSRDPKTT